MEALFNIETLINTYGYVGVFIVVFLESGIFFALPGDSLLFTAGILASNNLLNLYQLIPIIFIATFLGGVMGYGVGIYIEKLRKYSFLKRFLKQEHIDKAHTFFEKHGNFAIIVARFVPIVRTFTPIVAGIAKMEHWKYLKYNFVGSLAWSVSVTMVGYFLGNLFPNIDNHLHWLIIVVVVISCLPMLFSLLKKKEPARAEAK